MMVCEITIGHREYRAALLDDLWKDQDIVVLQVHQRGPQVFEVRRAGFACLVKNLGYAHKSVGAHFAASRYLNQDEIDIAKAVLDARDRQYPEATEICWPQRRVINIPHPEKVKRAIAGMQKHAEVARPSIIVPESYQDA